MSELDSRVVGIVKNPIGSIGITALADRKTK